MRKKGEKKLVHNTHSQNREQKRVMVKWKGFIARTHSAHIKGTPDLESANSNGCGRHFATRQTDRQDVSSKAVETWILSDHSIRLSEVAVS